MINVPLFQIQSTIQLHTNVTIHNVAKVNPSVHNKERFRFRFNQAVFALKDMPTLMILALMKMIKTYADQSIIIGLCPEQPVSIDE